MDTIDSMLADPLEMVLPTPRPRKVAQIQRTWSRRDWWLDADETLLLGFADEAL